MAGTDEALESVGIMEVTIELTAVIYCISDYFRECFILTFILANFITYTVILFSKLYSIQTLIASIFEFLYIAYSYMVLAVRLQGITSHHNLFSTCTFTSTVLQWSILFRNCRYLAPQDLNYLAFKSNL